MINEHEQVQRHPLISEDLRNRVKVLRAVVFDFDGVFTDNTVFVDQNGVESVRCWRGDGIGLTQLRALGLKTLILSTESNAVVSVRAGKLNTQCLQGTDDKALAILRWSDTESIPLDCVAFVGNDINDIPAFREVGVPIGVADSHPDISAFIVYRTRAAGGFGAVREVCDLIVNARTAD